MDCDLLVLSMRGFSTGACIFPPKYTCTTPSDGKNKEVESQNCSTWLTVCHINLLVWIAAPAINHWFAWTTKYKLFCNDIARKLLIARYNIH